MRGPASSKVLPAAAAGLLEGYKLATSGMPGVLHDALLTAGIAAIAGLAAIDFMMRWLQGSTFTIFVVYRLIFGALLLYLVYGRGL